MSKGEMYVELPPRASTLIESLRDMGYSLSTALADVIDNSITAGAKHINIFADTHDGVPAIGIVDDGTGMTEDELLEAMRPGSSSPLAVRDLGDLGRFGLGLKTASFSQCRRLTVVTSKDGNIAGAVWDLDVVSEKENWVAMLLKPPLEVRWSRHLKNDGTLVIWEKLDRLIDRDDSGDRHDLVMQLDEAISHIEFVFHRFLSGRDGSRISMSLNGTRLKAFDPFNASHPATQHHAVDYISIDNQEMRIWPVTLPHHEKVSEAEWKRYAGPEGYVTNQGFYLYRNRRLIVYGTWFRLARHQELTKLARVGIDIPNTLDSEWKIDVRKASAQPPPVVRERLRRIIEKLGVPSKRTYTARGTKLTDGSRLPVWLRIRDKNYVSYEVNVEHPLITSFSEKLHIDQSREFRRILRLIATGLPLDSLHVDISGSPDLVRSQLIDSEDFLSIVSGVWEILVERGHTTDEVIEWMRTSTPFNKNWQKTQDLIDSMTVESE